MNRIIISLLLMFFATPVFAQTITPYQPHYTMYGRRHLGYRIPHNNINALEKYLLKKNYSKESDISRLQRLEEITFGSIQNGDIAARYRNVENAILSRPQYDYQKQSLLYKIGNYFAGQTTGFTPSIIQPVYNYNSYPGYQSSRIDQFSNGLFNNGYRILNNNYTSGSSIRILD